MCSSLFRAVALAVPVILIGCSDASRNAAGRSPDSIESPSEHPRHPTSPPEEPDGLTARPEWLGNRVLPLRPDGYGAIQPTPRVLRNRRLATIEQLPPPPTDDFTFSIAPVRDAVRDRSTWSPGCPVGLEELRYIRLSFWGFDHSPHTGELLVHRSAARALVDVFRSLYRSKFPIEEMRVVTREELDAPPTGDGNNTTAFVCRPTRGATSWSQHAYGLAVDINPFHNPYVKEDVVLPELASAYTNREWDRPGMIFEAGPAVAAFDRIGWGWGGRWNSLVDYMHFSANGR